MSACPHTTALRTWLGLTAALCLALPLARRVEPRSESSWFERPAVVASATTCTIATIMICELR